MLLGLNMRAPKERVRALLKDLEALITAAEGSAVVPAEKSKVARAHCQNLRAKYLEIYSKNGQGG